MAPTLHRPSLLCSGSRKEVRGTCRGNRCLTTGGLRALTPAAVCNSWWTNMHRVRTVKCRRFNLQLSTCRVVGRTTARSGGQKPQETNVREGSAPAR